MVSAAIYGLSGLTLTADEAAFFRDCDPAGYILFKRNIEDPVQLRALTDALRDLSGNDRLPILIDQEGGRVARMRGPHWPSFPTGEAFAKLWDVAPSSAIEAIRVNARALGLMLRDMGITVDCLPLLDVRQEGADDIIGDRALGTTGNAVASLGRATLDGLASAGCVGVVKHIPGHGRALVDSHKELPIVPASAEALELDLFPFERLNDAPMAMVAHVLYTAWDANRPASQSPTVIGDIIRTRIGFDGFLMSDDSNMGALEGTPGERAAACVAAGCDVALPCDGVLENNIDVANAVPALTDKGRARLDAAMQIVAQFDDEMDFAAAVAKRDTLLALA